MASVTYDHVWKRYGEVVAVQDLNLAIEDKEFLVLVGPSGCGKTTALRCLAGLEEITEGQVMIDDQVVNDIAPKDRDIAMVFQSYALYPHMSVYDNMAFGLKLRKFDKADIDRRVMEAAKTLGIENLLKRKPASFPAVSVSVWLLGVPSCASQRFSSLMSLSPTSTRNSASRPARSSPSFTSVLKPPLFMLPMTKPKP